MELGEDMGEEAGSSGEKSTSTTSLEMDTALVAER